MLLPLHRLFICCLFTAISLSLFPAALHGQSPVLTTAVKTIIPGRVVFKLKAGATQQRNIPENPRTSPLTATLARLNIRNVRPKFPYSKSSSAQQPGAVDLGLILQAELPATLPVAEACRALLKTGAVEYAEPLYSYPTLFQPNDPLSDSTRAGGQYYLKNIRAYRAWDISQGDTSVVIGIVDGGTRLTHEDLASQIQVNRLDPIDGIDNDLDGYVDNYYGWDFADNDNDPSRDPSSVHGILVAGCAAAAPNNSKGIAGVGYRCRFMPLKIYPSTDAGVFGGFEAIVYAADHGCKVINLSWGGAGGRSQFEQDVITYAAVNRDAVVVAAAGNTPADLDFYPASYDHVLSVATLQPSDERSLNATYSRRVDLSAPGTGIVTTWGDTDSDYGAVGGSSFAAPLVSGAAGLLRTHFPTYNAAQIAAQIRRTTDNINALPGNAAFAGRIGSGRLNVLRALTETSQQSARVVRRIMLPARRSYANGDTIRLTVTVQNLLSPVRNLSVTVTSLSPYVTVRQGSFAVGALATLAQRANADAPFRLAVATTGVPLNAQAVLRYRLEDVTTGYREDQYETIQLNPNYVVLNINDLQLTLTSRGNLGYDGLGSDAGEGVSYRGSGPLLAEGGLLIATPTSRLADNVRNDRYGANHNFYALARASRLTQPLRADQEAYGVLRDSLPSLTKGRSVGVRVRQRAYAWATAPHRDYVVVEYSLTNLTADTLKPLHIGLYMDWDLPGEPARNAANWDASRHLGYLYDPIKPTLYAGVQHLSGGQASVYSIDNQAPAGTAIRLADGFSAAEKLLSLTSGTSQRTAGLVAGTDASQVVGATLPRLAPADSVVVAFAILGAPSLAQLQAAADAAATRYQQVLTVRPTRQLEVALYPNPTTGKLLLQLPAGAATVRVLSALGQELLVHTAASGGNTQLDLSPYPPGVYLVQISTVAGSTTRRVVRQP
ncbi:T9SS C-terminal target domain-containing protein [Hymenobacter sediminis]|uniref:S8 family peptidase n=1 Tax=Hymenobacter sediminis TaxID=2218621 RepID=UPI000DA6C914|nr:S8 family peptidase [Hymenobacter sediminis]RPD45199.1 T9SS C-terminal target domain-containing protein [Hymenobacter sediminis]